MTSIYGIEIIESIHAIVRVSGKPFVWKKWMKGRCYYKRQTKKLAEVHGPLVYKPTMYMIEKPSMLGRSTRQCLVVHPSLMGSLKREFEERYG